MSDSPKKVIRILSMDGGGVRGVAVARILEEIEKACKKPIHQLFDVVIGTSTGGLLSIMMGVPTRKGPVMSAEEAKKFYLDQGTTIFPPRSWLGNVLAYTLFLPKTLTKPKYSPKGLESVIRGHYGDSTTLASAKTCVGVVASDIRYAESLVFNSMRAKMHPDDERHNASVIKIGRATSAAPLFLPPISIGKPRIERSNRRSITWDSTADPEYLRGNVIFEDGGTTHNNPAYLGIKLAKAQLNAHGYNEDDYQFQVISIGTGNETGTEEDPTLKEKGWRKHNADGGFDNVVRRVFIDDVFGMNVKEYRAHLKVKAKLGNKEGAEEGSNYFRIQFGLKKAQQGHMDNSKRDNMEALVKAAETYLFEKGSDKYSDAFQSLADFLNQEHERPVFDKFVKNYKAQQAQQRQQPMQATKGASDKSQLSQLETTKAFSESSPLDASVSGSISPDKIDFVLSASLQPKVTV